jgi:hypothetical protein
MVSGARKAAVLLARAFNKRQFKFQVKSKKVTFLFLSTDNANNAHCIALLTKDNENKKTNCSLGPFKKYVLNFRTILDPPPPPPLC